MTTGDIVQSAIDVFAKNAEVDFDAVRAALEAAGLAKDEAAAALEFVPLAFGRAMLNGSGIEFAKDYIRIDANGREVERKQLVREPLFLEASMLAPLTLLRQGQDAFTAVAMRSSEVQAVNNALNGGADLANLQASPPVMMSGGTSRTSKPWWKFW
jgi:hypothetical protein